MAEWSILTMEEKVKRKKLVIRNVVGTPSYFIKFENGGELPKYLSGVYTSMKIAQQAIDSYLIKMNRKDASDTSE